MWWSTAPSREAESKVLIKDSIHFHLFGVLRVNWFSLLLHTLFISLPVPICSHYLLASDAATISFHSRRQMRVKPKAKLFCAAIDKWKHSSGNQWRSHSLGLSGSDVISSSFPFLAPQSSPILLCSLTRSRLSLPPLTHHSLSCAAELVSSSGSVWQNSHQLNRFYCQTHTRTHRRAL